MLDLLNEVAALRADLADARGAFSHAPPSDESWLHFGSMSQKGGVHNDKGRWADLSYFGVDCILGGDMFFIMCCIC